MVRSKLSGVFLAVFVLHAQYPPGQYPPGGQYPRGGQYPQGGGGGTGIPMPRIKLPKRKPKEPEVKAEPKPAADTLGFGIPSPSFPGFAGWSESVVLPAFQRVLIKEATPEQAVDEMIEGLAQAIA